MLSSWRELQTNTNPSEKKTNTNANTNTKDKYKQLGEELDSAVHLVTAANKYKYKQSCEWRYYGSKRANSNLVVRKLRPSEVRQVPTNVVGDTFKTLEAKSCCKY